MSPNVVRIAGKKERPRARPVRVIMVRERETGRCTLLYAPGAARRPGCLFNREVIGRYIAGIAIPGTRIKRPANDLRGNAIIPEES